MRTRSSWIWCWVIGAVLASGVGAQQYTTIIDNLPTCTGNRNGRIIVVSDAVSDSDCTVGEATGEDRFVHPCICDTLNALGPYWKAVGGGAGSSGPADALASAVVIEGATADGFEGNFTFADPTADWTWAWNATGGVTIPGSIFAPTTGFSHATTPAYSFAGDPDTGIYDDSANDTIKFAAGGSRRAYIGTSAFALDSGMTFYTDTLYITPFASPPQSCNSGNEGYIYGDTSHALCWCDGTTWQKLSGAGTCA